MRSFYFRPHPILSLLTLLGLGLLIKLGVWQKQRLEWKTELLTSVDAAVNAPAFRTIDEIEVAINQKDFTEFRRVDISAELLPMDAPFFVYSAKNRDVSWRKFQLTRSFGKTVFADIGIVSDAQRKGVRIEPAPIRLVGYVRTAEWQDTPRTKSSPEANRWFGFNPMPSEHDWSDITGQAVDMRFFIETVPGILSGDSLPPKKPEIANNHFDYMLTWFSLAFILLIFYGLIHIRDGRAGWRASHEKR